ncbi:hypothetical protein V6Z11_D07G205700 [Gossypium hirsutum]
MLFMLVVLEKVSTDVLGSIVGLLSPVVSESNNPTLHTFESNSESTFDSSSKSTSRATGNTTSGYLHSLAGSVFDISASAAFCNSIANPNLSNTSFIDGLSVPTSAMQLSAISTNTLKHSGAIFPIKYGSITLYSVPSAMHCLAQCARLI